MFFLNKKIKIDHDVAHIQKHLIFNLYRDFSISPRGVTRLDSDSSAEALFFDHLIPRIMALKGNEQLTIQLDGYNHCYTNKISDYSYYICAHNFITHSFVKLVRSNFLTKDDFFKKINLVYSNDIGSFNKNTIIRLINDLD